MLQSWTWFWLSDLFFELSYLDCVSPLQRDGRSITVSLLSRTPLKTDLTPSTTRTSPPAPLPPSAPPRSGECKSLSKRAGSKRHRVCLDGSRTAVLLSRCTTLENPPTASRHSQGAGQVLAAAHEALQPLASRSSLTPYSSPTSATPASLLYPEHTRLASASGPLHLLFPPPEMICPQISLHGSPLFFSRSLINCYLLPSSLTTLFKITVHQSS